MWTISSRIWRTGSRACAAALSVALLAATSRAEPVRVFAAASLTEAMDAALAHCEDETGIAATGVYSGTPVLARQIGQGAPADVFVSASVAWMDWAESGGLLAEETRADLLANRLVWIVNRALWEEAGGEPDDGLWIPLALERGIFRYAVADTATVPAGIYAKQALESVKAEMRASMRQGGVAHDGDEVPLVEGASVREALAWVARGEVAMGIVYASDARVEPRVAVVDTYPESFHDPIRYPAAVVAERDGEAPRALLGCLRGAGARAAFSEFGFGPPGGQ